MSIEPRPIADVLAELLPKYLNTNQKPGQPECMSHPEFADTVERFRDLNNIRAIPLPVQSRMV